jgi:hypothetical protein
VASIFARKPKDPRKPVTGTSMQAKGTIPVPSEAMKEQGSARPSKLPDVVPQLQNRLQASRVYKEMEDGDTTFDVAMRAAKVPIQGATFYVQAFDQKPENREIAEFVHYNIFESTSRPFVLVLEDILRMFNDGFSILEQVWETREWTPRRTGANRRKYTMLKKLASRPGSTITDFVYDDNGGPISVKHNAIRADNRSEEVEIKIEKLMVFTFGGVGGDLTGKPLGRTAYQPWYFKKELYKIDAVGHERNRLGIPVWELAEGYSSADASAAWEQVTNIRTNEKTGVVEPPGHSFRFEAPKDQPTDIMASIEHHDAKIIFNVMAQFLLLGLTGGGGRATSGSQVDMFQKAMKYIAEYIAGVFNLYLIPKLVSYNYPTFELPSMRVRNIGETKDLQNFASAHANLLKQMAITLNLDTENWYREALDMPLITQEEWDTGQEKIAIANNTVGNKSDVNPDTGDTSVDPGFETTAG